MLTIQPTPRYQRALASISDIMKRQRLGSTFTGSVARAAWLGSPLDDGSIDLLALMQPQQKNQIAMMASHRGYRVEQDQIDQSEELDLIPLNFVDPEGDIKVHVLVASNALYAKMINDSVEVSAEELVFKVPAADDLAILSMLAEDHEAVRRLKESQGFDAVRFQRTVRSIGLAVAGEPSS